MLSPQFSRSGAWHRRTEEIKKLMLFKETLIEVLRAWSACAWFLWVYRIEKPKALSLMLHTADISHPAKAWELHHRWTMSLLEEFFRQVPCATPQGFHHQIVSEFQISAMLWDHSNFLEEAEFADFFFASWSCDIWILLTFWLSKHYGISIPSISIWKEKKQFLVAVFCKNVIRGALWFMYFSNGSTKCWLVWHSPVGLRC